MICHYCRKPLAQALALPIKVADKTTFMHKDCLFQFAESAEKIERETQALETQFRQITGGQRYARKQR